MQEEIEQSRVQISSQEKRIKEKDKKILLQEEKIADLQEQNLA
jgi:hypothetical protein